MEQAFFVIRGISKSNLKWSVIKLSLFRTRVSIIFYVLDGRGLAGVSVVAYSAGELREAHVAG